MILNDYDMIVCDEIHAMRIQARNRFRQDIEVVGYYNVNKAKNKKKAENRKNVGHQEWIIPENYLNIPLDKKKKDALILDINFPKKWTTLKKVLLENGYKIKDKNLDGQRFSVISL